MTGDKVFWEKTNYKNFSHIIPLDYHLVSYDESNIRIKKRPISRIVENGFSLLGFAPFNWSHFLFQYYPKLDALVKIKENFIDEITLIIRKDLDLHTKQLISDFTSRINNLTILEVELGEKILCRNLFYVSNTSFIADSSNCMYFYNEIVPKYTLDFLRRAVLEVKKKHLSMVDDSSNKFLFLGRKGTRNIVNYSEVESFFHQVGFITIFPDELSLKEKVHLFHNATIVAGPGSSAFSNLIFCEPKTKVLLLINLKRISEPLIGYLIEEFNLDGTLLSGLDTVDNSMSSDYLISIKELKSCFEELKSR
jgi:capsular polysaccharide biosynthesis protein